MANYLISTNRELVRINNLDNEIIAKFENSK